MVQQMKSYKAIEVKKDAKHAIDVHDKGKQKEIGIKINEPTKFIQIHDSLSPSDIELEKMGKEKDALAKKLEIVENEATIAEMNNKIKFLENAKN